MGANFVKFHPKFKVFSFLHTTEDTLFEKIHQFHQFLALMALIFLLKQKKISVALMALDNLWRLSFLFFSLQRMRALTALNKWEQV